MNPEESPVKFLQSEKIGKLMGTVMSEINNLVREQCEGKNVDNMSVITNIFSTTMTFSADLLQNTQKLVSDVVMDIAEKDFAKGRKGTDSNTLN